MKMSEKVRETIFLLLFRINLIHRKNCENPDEVVFLKDRM